MKAKLIFAVSVYLGTLLLCNAQDIQKFKSTISSDNLQKHVIFLSGKEFGGRVFSSKGENLAADYVRQQFISNGLESKASGSDNYYQNLTIAYDTLLRFNIENKNKKLVNPYDFHTWEWCFLPDTLNVEIVYAGFGLDRPDYSDYRDVDVKGKWVVVESNSPVDSIGELLDTFDFDRPNNSNNYFEYVRKKRTAEEKGALGVIVRRNSKLYIDNLPSIQKNPFYSYRISSQSFNQMLGFFPLIVMRHSALDSLMGVDSDQLNQMVLSQLKKHESAAGRVGSHVSFSIHSTKGYKKSQNVIGVVKGKQENSSIVISAHYDGVASEDTSKYIPAANDNASGIAAIIELSNAFSKAAESGLIPNKNLIFVAFAGEEEGLIGSEFYVEKPLFPFNDSTVNINFDCIGVVDSLNRGKKNFTYVLGTERDLEYFKSATIVLNDSINYSLDFNQDPLNLNFPLYNFSDNASFSNKGIHALFLSCGFGFIHTPEDKADKIDFKNMEGITHFAFDLISQLAY